MQQVITEAVQAVGSDTAAISLRQGDRWVISYVHGFPPDVIGAPMDDRQEPHAVLAIKTKKPVVINDAFTDGRVNCEHMKKWGVHSVLVVPMVTEDEVIGVLFFNQHKPGVPFQECHTDFADHLASALSLRSATPGFLPNSNRSWPMQEGRAAHQEANEQLQLQAEETRVANEELQSQSEELHAANEELRAQQEELQAQTEELLVAIRGLNTKSV